MKTSVDTDTIGPLLQAILNKAWTDILFVPGSGAYLPDLIKNGDASHGIDSYDPAMINGKQSAINVAVPQTTRDLACASGKYPVIPVGVGDPTLTVDNLELINLHAVERDGVLTFPPGDQVQGNVKFGNLGGIALPLIVQSQKAKVNNYEFAQACCVPVSTGSPVCSVKYSNTGTGYFIATATNATGVANITIDTEKLRVKTINDVKLTIPPSGLTVDFTVDQTGGDLGKEAMEAFAKAAVQTGIAHNQVEDAINNMLSSPELKANITKIINQAIEGALGDTDNFKIG
jgi:hypothetical protein